MKVGETSEKRENNAEKFQKIVKIQKSFKIQRIVKIDENREDS